MAQTHHYLVGIAGNIGVGKTTLTQLLSKTFGWKAYYESVIHNPYLDDFYQDMKRWSFNLQIYFLSNRFRTLKAIAESREDAIQDRTIYEDVEIFAKSLFEQGYMTERDYLTYRDLFYDMMPYIPAPYIIIYLKASPEILLERIRKRGRGFEKTISKDYIFYLNESYEKWIAQAKKQHRIVVINSDKINYMSDKKDFDEIIRTIKAHFPPADK